MEKEDRRPKYGDIVIWDTEPEQIHRRYWVRTQSRGSDTQLFEGPDAWDQAFSAARVRAGPEGTIWKRHKDGRFERIWG
jgi:hypothetical protein